MRHALSLAIQAATVLALGCAPAMAQVEIGVGGGGLGGFGEDGAGGLPSLDWHMTVPINHRVAIEGYMNLMNADDWAVGGLYGVQVRQRILRLTSAHTDVFATYGIAGAYSYFPAQEWRSRNYRGEEIVHRSSAHAEMTVPVVPLAGIGAQR